MSDGITDAAKQTAEAVRRFQLQYLKDIPTNLIVDELCKREGVKEIVVEKYQNFDIYSNTTEGIKLHVRQEHGAARILVVRE
jgi:hypothetical protein